MRGGQFVVGPPGKSARHRIFKRYIAKRWRTTPPRHSCRSRTLCSSAKENLLRMLIRVTRTPQRARRGTAGTTDIIPRRRENCKAAGKFLALWPFGPARRRWAGALGADQRPARRLPGASTPPHNAARAFRRRSQINPTHSAWPQSCTNNSAVILPWRVLPRS